MIKIIYSTIVANPKELETTLIGMDIAVHGISTFESPDTPETWVFVPNETTESEKLQIDGQVQAAEKKPAPIPEELPEEAEKINEEFRVLPE